MDLLLLVMAVLFQGGFSVAGALYARRSKDYNPFLYAACVAFAALIFFVCYNKFQFRYDSHTLKLSLLFSLSYIVCILAQVYAVKAGPVAVSSVFFSLSLLIPTFFGVIFWKESIGPSFWAGIALVCCSVILMYTKRPGKEASAAPRMNAKWALYVLLAFVGNGACSVVQTYHQKTGGAAFKGEFMILTMAVVMIFNLLAYLTAKQKSVRQIKSAGIGLVAGLMNAVVNLAVMLLSSGGVIAQSIFFPVISVGSMVIVYISSLVLFREKLTLFQNLGVLFGVAAIVLLQL